MKVAGHPPRSNLILFAYLMAASVVAIAAMSPALLFLLDPTRPEPLFGASGDPVPFVVGFAAANVILSAVAIAVGLRLEALVGMGVTPPRSGPGADQTVGVILLRCSAIAVGLAAGVVACGIALRSQLPELPANFVFPPAWQGILMMLGAAIREEILFRFFAMNLFVWMVMKVVRQQEPTTATVWTANVFIALVFAVMHLIPASQLLALNAVASGMAIAIATTASLIFGWIYWRHGLLMAVFTHALGGLLVYLAARGLIALAQ